MIQKVIFAISLFAFLSGGKVAGSPLFSNRGRVGMGLPQQHTPNDFMMFSGSGRGGMQEEALGKQRGIPAPISLPEIEERNPYDIINEARRSYVPSMQSPVHFRMPQASRSDGYGDGPFELTPGLRKALRSSHNRPAMRGPSSHHRSPASAGISRRTAFHPSGPFASSGRF